MIAAASPSAAVSPAVSQHAAGDVSADRPPRSATPASSSVSAGALRGGADRGGRRVPPAPPAPALSDDTEWVYDSRGARYRRGPGPWCGTAGGYCNHRCRCDACTAAWRAQWNAYMAAHPEQREKKRQRDEARRRAAGLAVRPPRAPDPRCPIGYGSLTGYKNRGCRCEYCTAANTAYARRQRAAK